MPRAPTPANDNRPAEFDAHLAAAYPRLLARAKRFSTDPGALAGQAVVVALHRWRTFRQTPGNPYAGFYTWLCWCMKGAAADYKEMTGRRIVMVSADAVDNPPEIQISGAQEASSDLSTLLGALTARERDVILRRAGGETLQEISLDWSVTRERVRQIESEARAKVMAMAANDNVARKAA